MNKQRIAFWCVLAPCAIMVFAPASRALAHVHEETDSGVVVKRQGDEMMLSAYYYSFPPTGRRRDSLIRAKNNMELVPMDFEINHEWSTRAAGRKNGRDQVWYTDDSELLKGHPAATWVRSTWSLSTGWHIKETDIVIDENENWIHTSAYLTHDVYGGDADFVDKTIMHELGHALGLDHEDRYYNVMGDAKRYMTLWTCPGTDRVEALAGEDAGVGLVQQYGSASRYLKNDLSVTHWKYAGSDGEYSEHEFVRVHPHVSSGAFYGEMLRYDVTRGETYEFEFTYENNGLDTQYNVEIEYVVSTNDKISTHDIPLLTTSTWDIAPNHPFTLGIDLTIPTKLKVGQTYFIGVIVDCNDEIKEFKETNNTSFVPVEVH